MQARRRVIESDAQRLHDNKRKLYSVAAEMIEAYGKSDIGRKRQRNEDSFIVNTDIHFYLVADGMGGHNAGDVASSTASRTIESFMIHSHQERELTWPFGIDPRISFDANRLRTALKLANHKVWQLADANQDYNGMGTTVVCVVITGDVVSLASVGDSRAYLLRNDELRLLTRDDIWMNETWVRRAFSEEQLQKIPLKNVLSKAIGSKEDVEFPVLELQLQQGDLVFLCSDGLYGMLQTDQIASILKRENSLEDACRSLIDMANEAGGKDNITAVLLRYTAS